MLRVSSRLATDERLSPSSITAAKLGRDSYGPRVALPLFDRARRDRNLQIPRASDVALSLPPPALGFCCRALPPASRLGQVWDWDVLVNTCLVEALFDLTPHLRRAARRHAAGAGSYQCFPSLQHAPRPKKKATPRTTSAGAAASSSDAAAAAGRVGRKPPKGGARGTLLAASAGDGRAAAAAVAPGSAATSSRQRAKKPHLTKPSLWRSCLAHLGMGPDPEHAAWLPLRRDPATGRPGGKVRRSRRPRAACHPNTLRTRREERRARRFGQRRFLLERATTAPTPTPTTRHRSRHGRALPEQQRARPNPDRNLHHAGSHQLLPTNALRQPRDEPCSSFLSRFSVRCCSASRSILRPIPFHPIVYYIARYYRCYSASRS